MWYLWRAKDPESALDSQTSRSIRFEPPDMEPRPPRQLRTPSRPQSARPASGRRPPPSVRPTSARPAGVRTPRTQSSIGGTVVGETGDIWMSPPHDWSTPLPPALDDDGDASESVLTRQSSVGIPSTVEHGGGDDDNEDDRGSGSGTGSGSLTDALDEESSVRHSSMKFAAGPPGRTFLTRPESSAFDNYLFAGRPPPTPDDPERAYEFLGAGTRMRPSTAPAGVMTGLDEAMREQDAASWARVNERAAEMVRRHVMMPERKKETRRAPYRELGSDVPVQIHAWGFETSAKGSEDDRGRRQNKHNIETKDQNKERLQFLGPGRYDVPRLFEERANNRVRTRARQHQLPREWMADGDGFRFPVEDPKGTSIDVRGAILSVTGRQMAYAPATPTSTKYDPTRFEYKRTPKLLGTIPRGLSSSHVFHGDKVARETAARAPPPGRYQNFQPRETRAISFSRAKRHIHTHAHTAEVDELAQSIGRRSARLRESLRESRASRVALAASHSGRMPLDL